MSRTARGKERGNALRVTVLFLLSLWSFSFDCISIYLKAFPWIVIMLDRLKITKHNAILFPLLEVSNQEKALKKSTSVSPFQTCTDTCPFIHMCLAIACQAFISNHSISSKKIHHAFSPSERKLLFIT